MAFSGIGKLIKDLVTGTPADTDYFAFGNTDLKKVSFPNLKKALGIDALNSALEIVNAVNGTDGKSFNKNFLLISTNRTDDVNKSAYFEINDANRTQWNNIPTTFPPSGTILGLRQVLILDDGHAMVKVTELYPMSGRQHFRFYNINSWNAWTVIHTV